MKKILSFLLLFIFLSSQSQTVIEMRQENGIYTIPCKVNGLKLRFIFDTGASNVSMSLSEILFMLKNDYISKEDIYGVSEAQLANGDIVENTEVMLREIEIGGIILKDVKANIIHEIAAPLLLGQSAIKKLGSYKIDGTKLFVGDFNDLEKNKTNKINYSDIIESNEGIWLHKSSMKPVNGEVTYIYTNTGNEGINFFLKQGKEEGPYREYYKNGQLRVEKEYTNGKINGHYRKWTEDGQLIHQSEQLLGVKNGKHQWWYSSGVIKKEHNWKNGKRNGSFKNWNRDGKLLKETNYLDNLKHGVSKEYYENGKIKEELTFLNGKRNGVKKRWGEKFYTEHTYQNDKFISSKVFINEKLITTQEIVGLHNSKDLWLVTDFGKHRIEKGTFNKDIPYNIYKYVDDKTKNIGTDKYFYENGKLRLEVYYDDESKMLNSKSWYENGNLKGEEGYVDGKIVWEKCYNKNGELTSCEN